MRSSLAEYIGHGWKVEQLEADSALVTRPKQWTKSARLLINPLYLLYFLRRDRQDRVHLTVMSNGEILETSA
jgi:hypothetical protein